MAEYRTVKMSFWTDPYIESLSADGKLLYIYLFTCPLVNNLGIMETTVKRIAYETDIDAKRVAVLLSEMEKNGKLMHDGNFFWLTNFIKNQCTTSPKLLQSMKAMLEAVESKRIRRALCLRYPHVFECAEEEIKEDDTVSIPYQHGTDTVDIPSGEYGTWNMEVGNRNLEERVNARAHEKPKKERFGQFQKVQLTDEEYCKLCEKYGESVAVDYIERLDGHIASKGDKYKSHYATILNWIRNDQNERKQTASTVPKATTVAQQRSLERQIMAQMLIDDRKHTEERRDANGSRIVTQSDGTELALPPGW